MIDNKLKKTIFRYILGQHFANIRMCVIIYGPWKWKHVPANTWRPFIPFQLGCENNYPSILQGPRMLNTSAILNIKLWPRGTWQLKNWRQLICKFLRKWVFAPCNKVNDMVQELFVITLSVCLNWDQFLTVFCRILLSVRKKRYSLQHYRKPEKWFDGNKLGFWRFSHYRQHYYIHQEGCTKRNWK